MFGLTVFQTVLVVGLTLLILFSPPTPDKPKAKLSRKQKEDDEICDWEGSRW